ncbi:MAG: lipopolysaccharide kinase InaA family protein [Gammaproteobacteria bacterium]|nr:MAG: lipopolysaccharide kinase InaA family protein [Gammaproteobacteria bacterium]
MSNQLASFDYDLPVPFSVKYGDQSRSVECLEVVRVLPGRRLVCWGRLAGNDVYIKIFVHPKHAQRDWQREIEGAHALEAARVVSPQLLDSGELIDGHGFVVVYEAIYPCCSFREAWLLAGEAEQIDDDSHELLLLQLVLEVAHMHKMGLSQQDLHLDNFIFHDQQLYVLDAGGIHAHGGSLDKSTSLDNLMLLFAQFTSDNDVRIKQNLNNYAMVRGLEFTDSDMDTALEQVKQRRQYRQRKFLSKVYRECSAFISRQTLNSRLMLDRQQATASVWKMLADPDAMMGDGNFQRIKSGNTCTLSNGVIDDRPIVIKRYNLKNVWHGLGRALRRTRASISWENAHLLRFHGISTPRPLALLERRFGPLRGRAWFIMSHVDGPDSMEYFTSGAVDADAKYAIALKFGYLFKSLVSHKISHGDMKASNFIIHAGEPVLLDLDAMKQHRSSASFEPVHNKDMQRFLKNWQDHPDITVLFEQAFARAGVTLTASH